jgi:VWFA-related protein
MKKSVRTLSAVLFAAVVVTAIAQEATTTSAPPVTTINVAPPPPPEDPNAFRVSSDVELVLLDVSVKDKDGGFVSGLSKEDFTIFENKVEQRVSIFQSQDVPVTVGLIVDNSGSIRRKKPEIVTAALTFVKNSNRNDEVFVVNFNDRVLMGLPDDMPFSGDINMLRQALLSNPAQGRTALYDALKTGLEHLDKGRLDKKTLVLVSDGGDNMSKTTKDEIMRMAEQSHVTIYAVGLYDESAKDKDPGFLKDLARSRAARRSSRTATTISSRSATKSPKTFGTDTPSDTCRPTASTTGRFAGSASWRMRLRARNTRCGREPTTWQPRMGTRSAPAAERSSVSEAWSQTHARRGNPPAGGISVPRLVRLHDRRADRRKQLAELQVRAGAGWR